MKNAVVAMVISGLCICACKSQDTEVPDKGAISGGGEFVTTATTKQLMTWILEPNSDIVWAAVGSVTTDKGEEKLAPKTDADWNNVRNSAATVAEMGNLLLVSPHKRDEDWVNMTHTMIQKANECVQAAEAKDVDSLFTAGGDLYLACTACHTKFVIANANNK